MARDEADETAHTYAIVIRASKLFDHVPPERRAEALATLAKLLNIEPEAIVRESRNTTCQR